MASSYPPTLVELQSVTKHYADGDVWALRDINVTIGVTEFVSIVGPSGCGKSTLLNMIGAIDCPTSGGLWFRGTPIDATKNLDDIRSRHIGFVFQSFHLLPNLTAAENVQIPMFSGDRRVKERRARAIDLLMRVGLGDRTNHLPGQLSNGQRQRVAIARALANEPELVLADEPTGALDSEASASVIELLRRVCADRSAALVVVTHNRDVASAASRTIVMKDGKIIEN